MISPDELNWEDTLSCLDIDVDPPTSKSLVMTAIDELYELSVRKIELVTESSETFHFYTFGGEIEPVQVLHVAQETGERSSQRFGRDIYSQWFHTGIYVFMQKPGFGRALYSGATGAGSWTYYDPPTVKRHLPRAS